LARTVSSRLESLNYTSVLLSLDVLVHRRGRGLLTGRNIRVMKRYNLIMSGKEQVGDTPPKITLV